MGLELQINGRIVPLREDSAGCFSLPYPIRMEEETVLQINYQSRNGTLLTMELSPPFTRQYYLPGGTGEKNLRIPLTMGEELRSLCLHNPMIRMDSLQLVLPGHTPFSASPLELLDLRDVENMSRELPGDHGLYRWELEPSILVFDYLDYQVQARWLKRLAFFVEKPGYRGLVLTNQELEGKHGWNAHDYSAQSLAEFFNATRDFPLNPEEYQLLGILEEQGIIGMELGSWIPLEGAIISLTRESSPLLREIFLAHEAVHGLFFVNPEFREAMFGHWETLDVTSQEAWKTFLRYNNHPYDSDFIYLTVNEMTAYFLQMPLEEQRDYFMDRYHRVAQANPEISHILEDFILHRPDFFMDNARAVEEILQIYYPLQAGNFHNP